MGWFSRKPRVEIAVGIEIDGLDRDLYNVGGDWHNLRIDQKINLATKLGYDLEFDEDDNVYISESKGSDGIVDGFLRMFLGEGNDQ